MGDQVDNVSAAGRPFHWVCGQCGSRGLYRDDDRLVGDYSIACPMCGNRYYGDVGGKAQGAAPVKVYFTKKPPAPSGPSHFTTERTANILTDPRRENKEREESMKGPCANCNRVMSIVGDHCCFVCYKAGNGLEGEEKEAALAAVKAKIEGRGLRGAGIAVEPGRPHRRARQAETTGSAEQAAGKKKRKYPRKEGPCCNCGRVLQIQAKDACCLCYPALKIESGEERERALWLIRQKLGVKEFAVAADESRQKIPDASANKTDDDIMRFVRGCHSVIILSAEEIGFIEALRAGRIAIIS